MSLKNQVRIEMGQIETVVTESMRRIRALCPVGAKMIYLHNETERWGIIEDVYLDVFDLQIVLDVTGDQRGAVTIEEDQIIR